MNRNQKRIAAIAFAACAIAQVSVAQEAAAKGLPLQPARNIEYTTDEGTWMSVDVSPDGKTIVFDLVGHIYTMPVAGGEAKAITSGFPFEGQPKFSPDGKRIVFHSDRSGDDNLWIANADGSKPWALTSEDNALWSSPIWSADGESIFVAKKKPHHYNSAFEIWRYDLKGGAGQQLLKSKANPAAAPTTSNLGPSLTQDQRYLFFARKSLGAAGGGRMVPWQVVQRDLKTGIENTITALQAGGFRPLVSPDGSKLIYGTRYEAKTALRIRDLKTGEEKWLKFDVQHDEQESAAARDVLPAYGFLPGAKEILLSYGGKIHRLNIETGTDTVIPFTAKIVRELGPELKFPTRVDESPVISRLIQGASISPDGKQVAFSSLTHLYVGDVASGSSKRFIPGEGTQYEPAWSPDGKWIAYVSWANGAGSIWKAPADGSGKPQRLTNYNGYYRYLAWSPDGSKIAALRASPYQALSQQDEWGKGLQTADIVLMPSSGGEQTVLATGDSFRFLHFSGENDRLYLTLMTSSRPLAADCELISMRLDGSERKTHLRVRGKDIWGADYSPIVQVWVSPDTKKALIVYRYHAYVSPMPTPGEDPPTVNISTPANALVRLTTAGADAATWTQSGKGIAWTLGASLFTLPLADVDGPSTASERKHTYLAAKKLQPKEVEFKVEMPRHKSQGTVVLRGARIITMKGEEVIANGDILVQNNRIVSVGPRMTSVPAGAKIMDMTGKTIMPGLVDTHAHWFEIRRGVLDLNGWSFAANLAYGVTTGRDPQTSTNDMFAYQDLIEAGAMIGPRAYSTGPGIFYVNDFQSIDEAVDVISRYKKYYRTNMVKSYMIGSRRQRQFVVEACKRLGMMPTMEGAADMTLQLSHMIDGFSGSEHQLPVLGLYKDVTQLVAKAGTFYTPTYIIGSYGGPGSENHFYQTTNVANDPKVKRFVPYNVVAAKASRLPWYSSNEYIYSQAAEADAAIHRLGGKICVGGHGQLQGLSVHWELWSLQSGKLTAHEALRMATVNGAEAIGLAQDLGSLEGGKLADLLVLRSNPLDNIRNTMDIEYVMKDGELFEGATLNQVWPKQKIYEPRWWNREASVPVGIGAGGN